MNPTAKQFCPRLSEARHLLPLIRRHLFAAAARHPLATDLELVPIVEDGLFGYELVPDRETHTYPILGSNAQGEPVLRKECLANAPPGALQLAAMDGRTVARAARALPSRSGRRDMRFPDWASAAKFACAELEHFFPGAPRRAPLLNTDPNASLERALLAAASRLAQWSPIIHFCGLPKEEQFGYALYGAQGGRGELFFRHPAQWTLHWKSGREVVCETWSAIAPDLPLSAHDRVTGDAPNVQRIFARTKSLR